MPLGPAGGCEAVSGPRVRVRTRARTTGRARASAGVAAGLALAAVLGGAGCGGGGGDDEVSARDWATAVCRAQRSWSADVQQAGEALNELTSDAPPATNQELLLDGLGGTVRATERLADRLDEAGAPDARNGDQAATRLRRAVGEARDLYAAARDQVAALPVDDPIVFTVGTAQVAQTLRQSAQGVGTAFARLTTVDSPALRRAFGNAPACTG